MSIVVLPMNRYWYISFNTVPYWTAVDTWHYKSRTRLLAWITSQNFISLACCRRRTTIKEAIGAHTATAGTPSSSLCQDPSPLPLAPVLRPLRRNRHGPFITATTGAPPRTSMSRCPAPAPCTSSALPSTPRPLYHCHWPLTGHPLLPFFLSGLHVQIVFLVKCDQHIKCGKA
jgi:hypothetical protein